MTILIVCGVNHNASSIEQRERVAMPKHCLLPALRSLASQSGVVESTILSTCNRTELYIVGETHDHAMSAARSFFAKAATFHGFEVVPDTIKCNDAAVLHLFRVASGFESMVIGEGQILSQVGEALVASQEAGTAGPLLNKLFNLAVHCGKRVRHETGISRKAVSVASAAVELADECDALRTKSILVIGAGRMGTLCTKSILSKCDADVTIFNPSQARLDSLCQAMAKQMHRIHATVGGASLASLISRADVIFVATSADQFLVTPEHFSGLTTTKFVFDLSMPRNVDPTVSQLPAVRLFTLDDLQQVVRRNLAQRKLLVLKAGPILVSILGQYKHWLVARTRPRVTKGAHRHAQFARKEISA